MQPTGTFTSSGIKLAYYEAQPVSTASDAAITTPAETIMLVHGFASHANMNWVSPGWFEYLTNAGYHVVAFDNRGHGESEKRYELDDYGSHLMAGDVKALVDHLSLGKVHLMGYSMGARISAFVTRDYPEILKSVIFAGMGYNMVRGIGNPEPIARALEAPSADDVKNPAAKNFRVFAEQTKSDLKALAACMRSSRVPVTAETMTNIKVPALVAVGTTDVIAGDGAKLAEMIPNGQHFPIEGRDHMRAVGDQSYKDGVLAFLKSVPKA